MHLFKVWTAALLVAQGVLHHSAVAAPTPEDVQQLAHIYAKAHPGEKAHWGDSLTEEYSLFFNGFLYGGGTDAWKASNLLEEAHAQGAARWRQGSEARQRTFAGYGYQRVELSGTWRSSFETSRFEAEGMREACWLDFVGDFQSDPPKAMGDSPSGERRIRVVGYLSPPGHYGHMDKYSRQLVAETVQLLKD